MTTIFLNTLKRILKQPVNWIFILLFPLIFAVLTTLSTQSGDAGDGNGAIDATNTVMYFGVADQDDSALSRTLMKQLRLRYNIIEMAEADITAALTDSEVPWVLLIREGYGADLLNGRPPALEGYSLTISDTSALGGVTAQNITRALLLLGTDDIQAIESWEQAARVDVTILDTADSWELIAFWFGFFGFVSIFTAYFIVKTLLDDKRGGMPDRISVLPVTPRRYLISGALAAFAVTEITVGLLLAVVGMQLGEIPNPPALFALLSIYNLFSVSMVLAIVSMTKGLGPASVAMSMLATFFAMLGGLFWPLEFVPEFMRKLAWCSPGYWLGRGLENMRQITFEGFGMPMLFLAGFSLTAILLGGWKKIQPIEE